MAKTEGWDTSLSLAAQLVTCFQTASLARGNGSWEVRVVSYVTEGVMVGSNWCLFTESWSESSSIELEGHWCDPKVNMDLWFFLLLLGSGLISVGANNVTAGPPTTVPTSPRSPTKAPTAGPEDGTTTSSSRLNMSTPGTVSTVASKPLPTTAARTSPNATTGSLNTSSTLGTTVPVPPATSLLPSVTPSAPHTAVPSTEAETTERNFSMVVTTQETSSASHNGEATSSTPCLSRPPGLWV
ncbi:hypothetical protein BTVI_121069 [Pitangus sulphuratus]|nr:hypothetical protein BTVI_121069 [Pitangus sulphuratus]